MLAAAAQLDRLLDLAPAPAPDAALLGRLIAAAPRPPPRRAAGSPGSARPWACRPPPSPAWPWAWRSAVRRRSRRRSPRSSPSSPPSTPRPPCRTPSRSPPSYDRRASLGDRPGRLGGGQRLPGRRAGGHDLYAPDDAAPAPANSATPAPHPAVVAANPPPVVPTPAPAADRRGAQAAPSRAAARVVPVAEDPPPPVAAPPVEAAAAPAPARPPLISAGDALSPESRWAFRKALNEANKRNKPLTQQARAERQAALSALGAPGLRRRGSLAPPGLGAGLGPAGPRQCRGRPGRLHRHPVAAGARGPGRRPFAGLRPAGGARRAMAGPN
ncbi:hypothetical protein ACRAWD_14390 [Caulobacter segnis]